MARRHELEDQHYDRIKHLLPENGRRGGQWRDHRQVLNGMFYRLNTGCPWRDLPERYGPWKTVHERFSRWSEDGTLLAIAQVLLIELDNASLIDWSLWSIDGSYVRATRAAAGARGDSVEKKAASLWITDWDAAEVVLAASCTSSPTATGSR